MRAIALMCWFIIGMILLATFFSAFFSAILPPSEIDAICASAKAIWNDHPIGVVISTVIFLALCHLMEVDERWKYRIPQPRYNLIAIAAYAYLGIYIWLAFYVFNGHY